MLGGLWSAPQIADCIKEREASARHGAKTQGSLSSQRHLVVFLSFRQIIGCIWIGDKETPDLDGTGGRGSVGNFCLLPLGCWNKCASAQGKERCRKELKKKETENTSQWAERRTAAWLKLSNVYEWMTAEWTVSDAARSPIANDAIEERASKKSGLLFSLNLFKTHWSSLHRCASAAASNYVKNNFSLLLSEQTPVCR